MNHINNQSFGGGNASVLEPWPAPAHPELLVSALLHLMSHYAVKRQEEEVCVRLASVIDRHLQALSVLPGLAPVLRATCQQLSEHYWAGMIERALPAQQKANLFERLARKHMRQGHPPVEPPSNR
jgi:hypothetical protein